MLHVILQDRRKTGSLDLEAVETSIRSAMHQAGASALTQLLQYNPPDADHRTIPCSCGHAAHYKELRSKTLLSVGGRSPSADLITCVPTVPKDITRPMPHWELPVWNPRRA